MEVEGIHTLFLFVSDLAASQAYYEKVLGKPPTLAREGMLARFDLGGVNLLLHSDSNATWLPTGAKKGVGMALHLQVSQIEAHWSRLAELGMNLPEEPVTLHTGIRKFAMKDPDGYEVEIV